MTRRNKNNEEPNQPQATSDFDKKCEDYVKEFSNYSPLFIEIIAKKMENILTGFLLLIFDFLKYGFCLGREDP
jgi:hypothetical protein